MMDEDERPSLEAYKIEITYGFDVEGTEYVTIEPNEPMSSILLVGILEKAKHRVFEPDEEYEDD